MRAPVDPAELAPGAPVDAPEVATGNEEVAEPSAARLRWRRRQLIRRDSVFRRALGLADMLSILMALGATSVIFDSGAITWATLAVPPLFVLLCKALGLYDRDEHLIHKTTLDEIPALFGIATLTSLLLVFSDGLFISSGLSRGEAFVSWALLFVLLVCLRSLARWVTTQVLPPERCLLVGDPRRASAFRRSSASPSRLAPSLSGNSPRPPGPNPGPAAKPPPSPDLNPLPGPNPSN